MSKARPMRKLRTKWSVESFQDMRTMFGQDAESKLQWQMSIAMRPVNPVDDEDVYKFFDGLTSKINESSNNIKASFDGSDDVIWLFDTMNQTNNENQCIGYIGLENRIIFIAIDESLGVNSKFAIASPDLMENIAEALQKYDNSMDHRVKNYFYK